MHETIEKGSMNEIIRIDVDAILAAKAGKKAKYVPRFLVSYLKKIIHQEEVNEFLDDAGCACLCCAPMPCV